MEKDLSASEAAAILGVSVATLYSYVSRGLLSASAADASRSKRYPREAVLRLAARKADGKRGGHSAAAAMDWGLPILETRISRIADGKLYYRGHDAVALGGTATLEAAACLLWSDTPVDVFIGAGPAPLHGLPDRLRAFAPEMAPLARAGVAMQLLAHALPDPVDRGWSIADCGPMLMRTLAAALLGTESSDAPLHQQMGRAWGMSDEGCDLVRCALVLLADHELNASTFAVRCVASTGASLPMVVGAGLAALSGPKHGSASVPVKRLLDAMRAAPSSGKQPASIAAGFSLEGGAAPVGFRHRLYPDGDPRAACLLARLSPLLRADAELADIIGVCIVEGKRRGHRPNLDFALAAIQSFFGWSDAATLALFALARSAGWIAHAAEQVEEGALLRPRARYVGRF